MYRCSKCGYSISSPTTICPACGAIFEADKAKPKPVVKPQPQPEVVKPKKESLGALDLVLKYSDFIDNETLYKLAICAQKGIGSPADLNKAKEMYAVLASRGYAEGMYKLAEILIASGSENELNSASIWLQTAADLGHRPSEVLLDRLVASGQVAQRKQQEINVSKAKGTFMDVVQEALPNVLTITAIVDKQRCSMGSGCIIEGGYVITNAHVVERAALGIIGGFDPTVDKKTYNLIPLAIEPSIDVAVLRFTGLMDEKITKRNNLRLNTELTKMGQPVYTIGNPLGVGLSASSGIISCPVRERDSGWREGLEYAIQSDITINHGNSGGALLNMDNEVLGLTTFTPGNCEGGMAMCVPASYVEALINLIEQELKHKR